MKIPRRKFLHLAGGAVALPAVSRFAAAQTYPSRPSRIVVGFGAGSSPDITARLMGQSLSERLGQQFVIDNRPGAGTNIATEAVVRAPADGHTLLWTTTPNAISATFYDKLNFDFLRDIAPVAGIIRFPLVMLVSPSFPAKTLPEFIAYAKSNPGKINMGSNGNGSTDHVACELFKMMAGVDLIHVPYRLPPFSDLISGQVQVLFPAMGSATGYIRAGTLRALAVTTAARAEQLPDIPTVAEFVPGYEASVFHGLSAPRSTPSDIVDKLSDEFNASLADEATKARLAELGGTGLMLSPAEFRKFLVEETGKWGRVVKSAHIKAG